MFTKKGYLIKSDEGFSVDLKNEKILYKESDRILKVGFERLTGPFPIRAYLGYPDQWEPPFENEMITDSDWERIAKNIVKAYDFWKVGIIVEIMEPDEIANIKRRINMRSATS